MKALPASPIMNPKEFLEGENAIMPPLYSLVPVKMSLMEYANGYVVEDAEENIYILSVGFISKNNWHTLGLPESDAYKIHMQNRIKKNGVQNVP